MIRYIKKDLRCGLHSNIPLCCILWFILYVDILEPIIIFLKFKLLGRLYLLYYTTFNRHLVVKKHLEMARGEFFLSFVSSGKAEGYKFEHHPCPFCLLHQFRVKVKKCKCYY